MANDPSEESLARAATFRVEEVTRPELVDYSFKRLSQPLQSARAVFADLHRLNREVLSAGYEKAVLRRAAEFLNELDLLRFGYRSDLTPNVLDQFVR